MKVRLILILTCFIIVASCAPQPIERATLPTDELLVIAHRGASAYVPEHTLAAYELAVEMEATYIEIDLQMTKDKKLVALHDHEISLNGENQKVSQLTLEELSEFSPGAVFNELYPELASPVYESFSVPELDEILTHFKDDVNYYIEIKSPAITPGMEAQLIQQLQTHQLLNRSDDLPKVIIQSFDTKSLKKVFAIEPAIPLIKLYSKNTKHLSDKEINHLLTYASGIGVNKALLSGELVNRLHENDLHIHPFVLNEETEIKNAIELGVDGLFTDKPDVAVQIRHLIKTTK